MYLRWRGDGGDGGGVVYNRAVFIFLASGMWAAVIRYFFTGLEGIDNYYQHISSIS